eukprot:SAG31_NODE_3315_length_4425_cov_6.309755_5_plen_95_part_00
MLLVLLSMSLASEPVDDQSTERRTVGSKIPIGALHPSISPEILRQTLQLQSTDDYASVQKLGVALRNSGFNHTVRCLCPRSLPKKLAVQRKIYC